MQTKAESMAISMVGVSRCSPRFRTKHGISELSIPERLTVNIGLEAPTNCRILIREQIASVHPVIDFFFIFDTSV